MSVLAALKRALGGAAADAIRVHVILKGRTGAGWHDVDTDVHLPAGATLATLLEVADRRGIHLRDAIAASPHLGHTLMLNGQRCPVEENLARPLADGDEIYLLAPLAGG
ncbi:MAG: MoaD/ThiS family protein [Deltaproteobacteria bacterium]|nr:MoaD/ThiS family protein [Deltaproteobacteria bacterium]